LSFEIAISYELSYSLREEKNSCKMRDCAERRISNSNVTGLRYLEEEKSSIEPECWILNIKTEQRGRALQESQRAHP